MGLCPLFALPTWPSDPCGLHQEDEEHGPPDEADRHGGEAVCIETLQSDRPISGKGP